MKCCFCGRSISGADPRRVEVRRSGRPEQVFGAVPGADDGLQNAQGVLVRAYHHKCWLANKRRQQLQAAKDADPSAQQRQQPDWREPVSARVEDIRPREGDRDC